MNAHASVSNAGAAIAAAAHAARPAQPDISPASLAFRAGMRKLAGAVSVLTVGQGEARTGLTATSVTSLSVEPPTLIICVNRAASAHNVLLAERRFGINVLATGHRALADRFAGRNGEKGPARYAGADWTTLETGAPVLADALASFDCELDEAIERHSHLIVLGRVVAARVADDAAPLLYWSGAYRQLGAAAEAR
ncbi:oxidoreductase [Azorhizobium oxalatiphilum]|uniref:Oxidoreductase n=1 Tax=Azorhizobium oxalatiphilum TaxID=980631 RepID=A0A917CIL5_9HYPH|nr:flavin reductase family protein [Azorhizobium oxalatiphilum]GGF89958.1 oxidoreductase [Azorhizobium oxalatiphilum]